MAIVDAFDRGQLIPETVSDLVQGFAVLARTLGPTLSKEHAFTLHATVQSLLARMEAAGWEESADLLREADIVLNSRIAPPR